MFFPAFNDLSSARLFAVEQAVSHLLATSEQHCLYDMVGQHTLSYALFEKIVRRGHVPPTLHEGLYYYLCGHEAKLMRVARRLLDEPDNQALREALTTAIRQPDEASELA